MADFQVINGAKAFTETIIQYNRAVKQLNNMYYKRVEPEILEQKISECERLLQSVKLNLEVFTSRVP